MGTKLNLSMLGDVLVSNQYSSGNLKGQFGTNTDFNSRQQYHDNKREEVMLTPQLFLTYMGAQSLNYVKCKDYNQRAKWAKSFTESCLSGEYVMMLTPFQSPERDDHDGFEAINYRHTAMAHSILIDYSDSPIFATKIINDLISTKVQSCDGGWPEWSLNKESSNIIASVYMAHFLFKFQNRYPEAPLHKSIDEIIISTLSYLEKCHSDGIWKQGNRQSSIRFYPTLYLLAYPVFLKYRGKHCRIISDYPKLIERLSNNNYILLNDSGKQYRTSLRYTLNLYFHSFLSRSQRVLYEKYRNTLLEDMQDHFSELNSHEIFGSSVLIDSLKHYETHENESFNIFYEKIQLAGELLIKELKQTNTGREDANNYHDLILKIFDYLFRNVLNNPKKEQIIDKGAKRADIVYFNSSKDGFFYDLSNTFDIYSPYIIIECKNYGKEINNPEFDQLAGRLSEKSGLFGILTCRKLTNKENIVDRCRSLIGNRKGYIIVLDDADFIELIELKIEESSAVDKYLELKMREILL